MCPKDRERGHVDRFLKIIELSPMTCPVAVRRGVWLLAACVLVVVSPTVSAQEVAALGSPACEPSTNSGVLRIVGDIPTLAPPLIAEPRAALVKVMAGRSNKFSFQQRRGRNQWVWDISLGHEFGVVGWNWCSPRGMAGINLWTPIDFHMIEDLQDKTAPILDTDYRFGLLSRGTFPVSGLQNRARMLIGFKAFVGHESTHIGDEFVTLQRKAHASTFFRVNVSYEYFDLAATWDEFLTNWSYSLRGGFTRLAPWKDGFYDLEPLEGLCPEDQKCLRAAQERTEPYSMGEVRWRNGWFLSADVRWKIIYPYLPELESGRRGSMNVVAGTKLGGWSSPSNRPAIFGRGYFGVNPHGQFRNQLGFWEYGFGIYFPLR